MVDNKINADIKQASIMVVDDEYSNVKLLEKMLNAMGYCNVVCTQDPCNVVSLYKKYDSDLILLDINMPKLDGYAVMEQLSKLTDGNLPPILILTAQDMQSYRQRALDSGARDFVTKPFNVDELMSRVRNMLEVQMAHKYMAMQNIILENKVQERTQVINSTRLQIVRHLGRAAEYRDNETGLHIIRMSKIAVVLGKAVGMDEQQCELLLNASPMHDIGKIGIPDHILLKPGKLNATEWEIMQTHAQIGADILAGDDSDLMIMAREIALTHHEKWNGKGYPNNLNKENIPLVGRITSLADVFDALTSERPYKSAWPIDKAVNLISEESGQHFDPELVDVFLAELPQIIDINEKYAEPETKGSNLHADAMKYSHK